MDRLSQGMAGHIASSSSVDWNTPYKVIARVRELFGEIDLDPCSNGNSIVAATTSFCLPDRDGLQESWNRPGVTNAYVNPPFGSYYLHKVTKQVVIPKQMKLLVDSGQADKSDYTLVSLKDWVIKAEKETQTGALEVVMLLPAAVGTKAWQQHIFKTARGVCFVSGRLSFIGATAGAPMDCACVYWGNRPMLFADTFAPLGAVFPLWWFTL